MTLADKNENAQSNGVKRMEIPDGAWQKCKRCGRTLYTDQLEENLNVCQNCGYNLPVPVLERIEQLVDAASFEVIDTNLRSKDVLGFFDSKSYSSRLTDSENKTGLSDAVVCGKATIDGHPLMLGVMDFRFMGASMGSVVGERITRMVEKAVEDKLPVVLITASGGARMQEGILSLMQMPKTCGAFARLAEAGLCFIAVLTHPTYGGVTASFASIADIILAEPEAMIGFAGPRVIAETTNSKLPEGFQTAEFLLEKGLVDRVVERKSLRRELGICLECFSNRKA